MVEKKYVLELTADERSDLLIALCDAQMKNSEKYRKAKSKKMKDAFDYGHKVYYELFNKVHDLKVLE